MPVRKIDWLAASKPFGVCEIGRKGGLPVALSKEMKACIDACNDCVVAANRCVAAHLGEEAMALCMKMCLDCVDLAGASANLMARDSRHAGQLCGICGHHCQACAEECARMDSEECKACAEACRRCAEHCLRMAA